MWVTGSTKVRHEVFTRTKTCQSSFSRVTFGTKKKNKEWPHKRLTFLIKLLKQTICESRGRKKKILSSFSQGYYLFRCTTTQEIL